MLQKTGQGPVLQALLLPLVGVTPLNLAGFPSRCSGPPVKGAGGPQEPLTSRLGLRLGPGIYKGATASFRARSQAQGSHGF